MPFPATITIRESQHDFSLQSLQAETPLRGTRCLSAPTPSAGVAALAPNSATYGRPPKSIHSDDQGNCVEVADSTTLIAIRDSKNPDGPVLTFTPADWRAVLRSIRA
jgi:hypothetical protein